MLAASPSLAAVVELQNVSGVWSSVSADPYGGTDQPVGLNGLTTNEIRWGTIFPDGEQSGYRFDSAVPPVQEFVPHTEVVLGTFTHFNETIKANPLPNSITEATLDVTFDLMVGGELLTLTQSYVFKHFETHNLRNSGDACPNGENEGTGVNEFGCADRVTVESNPLSGFVEAHGKRYTFSIVGFERDGVAGPEFWTTETLTNTAFLKGKWEEVTVVPLPAAGWLLLAGLGGLGLVARRRRG